MVQPRRQRADGERTRDAILREAVSLATVDGLEGLSIGNLADGLHMSKSGVYAHFGSKEELQIATVDEAERIFRAEVIEPALAAKPGLGQLLVVCDAYLDHLARRTFPGGCFFAGAVLEMGTRPGPVKERIAAFQTGFTALIRGLVVTAIDQHELPADEDPDARHLRAQRHDPRRQLEVRSDATTPGYWTCRGSLMRRRLGIPETADSQLAP